MIEKMFPLTGMNNLKILSLARNRLKRMEKLEDVADTLEQLWVSYNEISSLDGLQGMNKLQVLYISNNSIKDWSELDKLVRAAPPCDPHPAPHAPTRRFAGAVFEGQFWNSF
jgi:dynein light chain 1